MKRLTNTNSSAVVVANTKLRIGGWRNGISAG
nr:MAG TPA: hypothetical protein [Caudoviricetes sp.]